MAFQKKIIIIIIKKSRLLEWSSWTSKHKYQNTLVQTKLSMFIQWQKMGCYWKRKKTTKHTRWLPPLLLLGGGRHYFCSLLRKTLLIGKAWKDAQDAVAKRMKRKGQEREQERGSNDCQPLWAQCRLEIGRECPHRIRLARDEKGTNGWRGRESSSGTRQGHTHRVPISCLGLG